MPEPLALASSRPARFVPAAATATELLGRSPAATRAQELVRRAATGSGCVLLVAAPGVDTESVARDLHLRSREGAAPFVAVDCGDTAASLERVLFGADAPVSARDLESIAADGRLAAARGGTLYLHSVVDLPAAAQTRLARAVRDGEVDVDGATVRFDVRLVAAAPPAIDDDVREHRFRPDLYRRLASTRIDLPSFRDRHDDVPALAERVLLETCASAGVGPRTFTESALALLSALNWPGNLAELRTVVERIVADAPESIIQVEQVVPALRLNGGVAPFAPQGTLRDARLRFEREYIAAVLQHHGWRMGEAARTLGIQRPNLYRKARQLGIPVTRLSD